MPTVGSRLAAVMLLLVIATGSCKKDTAGPGDEPALDPPFYTDPTPLSTQLAFVRLGAGYHHTCGVTGDGAAWCWGWNENASLGTTDSMDTCGDALEGPLQCSGEPQPVSGGLAFAAVFPSLRHTCALRDDGAAFCWGHAGGLGSGHTTGPLPRPVAGDHRFTALSASLVDFVTCGLAAGGQAWCWGPDHPNRGGLGTGSRGDAPAPVAVGDDLRFASLSVGEFHTCGVATDGAGWCWGGNWHGQLGIGSMGQEGGTMTTPLPALVLGDHAFTQIAAAVSHTCGLTPAGGVLCWGDGRPFGLARSATAPVAAADGIAFASVHAGGRHTCGLTAEGVAYCWGENDGGQLGDGSTEYRAEPTPVSGELRFSALTAGAGHTCGLATDGRAYCWGFNPYGEVGRRGSEVDPVGGAPD